MNEQDKKRVCKNCNVCFKLSDNFHKVKQVDDIVYYSHICTKCTINKRREYMKQYHKRNYMPVTKI